MHVGLMWYTRHMATRCSNVRQNSRSIASSPVRRRPHTLIPVAQALHQIRRGRGEHASIRPSPWKCPRATPSGYPGKQVCRAGHARPRPECWNNMMLVSGRYEGYSTTTATCPHSCFVLCPEESDPTPTHPRTHACTHPPHAHMNQFRIGEPEVVA